MESFAECEQCAFLNKISFWNFLEIKKQQNHVKISHVWAKTTDMENPKYYGVQIEYSMLQFLRKSQ